MDYIIIGILVLLVILVTISLFKNINEGKITERLGNLETKVTRELGDFKSDINRNLSEDFIKMMPPFRVEEFDTFQLKKYMFYGDVLGNLSLRQ